MERCVTQIGSRKEGKRKGKKRRKIERE